MDVANILEFIRTVAFPVEVIAAIVTIVSGAMSVWRRLQTRRWPRRWVWPAINAAVVLAVVGGGTAFLPAPSRVTLVKVPPPVPISRYYVPSGWMGDYKDISVADDFSERCRSVPCTKITYSAAGSQGNGWAGIYWQMPANNWGDIDSGLKVEGATKLTFWARGEKGHEIAEFKVGGLGHVDPRPKYRDSVPAISTGSLRLDTEWRQYGIDLTSQDLSRIMGGFVWAATKDSNPNGQTIYLSDIQFESSTDSASPTPTPLQPTPTRTATPVPTETPLPFPTESPTPTITPTPTPTATRTPAPSPTPTPTRTLAPPPTPGGVPRASLPASVSRYYIPSGWMGDWSDITFTDGYTVDCYSPPTCIKITYSARGTQGANWAGIYWRHPADNWGEQPGGFDLTGATRLTFWARGEVGGEVAEFKAGGLGGPSTRYRDSLWPAASTGPVVLTREWRQYTIPLTGADLSRIMGGFVWVTNRPSNPNGCTIYLDDIQYE